LLISTAIAFGTKLENRTKKSSKIATLLFLLFIFYLLKKQSYKKLCLSLY